MLNKYLNTPNILLIEDEPSLQTLHSIYLDRGKYNFLLAKNGIEAINAFNEHHFDLVLLDIELPDMNGLEVNSVIRSTYYGKKVPIIALTSLGKTIEKECLEVGVNQVFDKPLGYDLFSKILKTMLDFPCVAA